MKTLAPRWGQKLSQAQRNAWHTYAGNVSWTNVLGQTTFLTGHQHFLRCNIPRIQTGIAILEDAPTTYDLGTFTAPTIDNLWTEVQNIKIGFTKTDEWASTIGGRLLVYCSRPTNFSTQFFRGPYRYAGAQAGAEPPDDPPVVLDNPWPFHHLNQARIKCRIIQPDGRVSLPIILGPETIFFGP